MFYDQWRSMPKTWLKKVLVPSLDVISIMNLALVCVLIFFDFFFHFCSHRGQWEFDPKRKTDRGTGDLELGSDHTVVCAGFRFTPQCSDRGKQRNGDKEG